MHEHCTTAVACLGSYKKPPEARQGVHDPLQACLAIPQKRPHQPLEVPSVDEQQSCCCPPHVMPTAHAVRRKKTIFLPRTVAVHGKPISSSMHVHISV